MHDNIYNIIIRFSHIIHFILYIGTYLSPHTHTRTHIYTHTYICTYIYIKCVIFNQVCIYLYRSRRLLWISHTWSLPYSECASCGRAVRCL